jgi:fatty acid desaturase
MAPVYFLGRILLWVFLLPVGIWRSLVHHRKKGQRKAVEEMRKEMREG